jgi:hypothetical protein
VDVDDMRSFVGVFACFFGLVGCDACEGAPRAIDGGTGGPAATSISTSIATSTPSASATAAAMDGGARWLGDVAEIACGQAHTCARTTTGSVYCWGRNRERQLGAFAGERSAAPVRIDGLGRVAQIAATSRGACALASDASVTCWGDGAEAHRVAGLKALTSLAAGGAMACGLTGGGGTQCWGKDGKVTPGPSDLDGIVVGAQGACGFKRDATQLTCWGTTGAPKTRTFPEKIVWAAGDGERGCAGLDGARTLCWGASVAGELGSPPFDASAGAAFAAFDNPVSQVAFGGAFSCALLDGRPHCRGGNESGELGRGVRDRGKHVELVGVTGAERAIAIAAGGAHACAVMPDRRAACWGQGDQGQIGNATVAEALTAAPVLAPK